jgi:hypothetical protein
MPWYEIWPRERELDFVAYSVTWNSKNTKQRINLL